MSNHRKKRRGGAGRLVCTIGMCLIATGACASTGQARFDEGLDDRPVTVVVQNASFEQVRVYAVRGSVRYPLGIVRAASRTPVYLRESWLGDGELELVAEPSPGGVVRGTGPLHLLAGDIVEWSIDNHRAVYAIRHR